MRVRFQRRSLLPAAGALLGALSFALSFATSATSAEADGKRFGQEIIDILRDEGKIDQAQYEDLKKLEAEEHARAKASNPPASAAPAAEPDPHGFEVKYSNGLQFNRNDGMVKMKLGGRIQADFASIHPDHDLQNALDKSETPPASIGGDGEGVELRRTRLYMSGTLYDRIVFKSQVDFAGNKVAVNDQFIGMTHIPLLGTVLVGNMKEPFSLEEMTSSKFDLFMERSLGSILDFGRNFGLMFQNAYLDQRMTAAGGIFANSAGSGTFFSHDRDFNVAGRVTGLPFYDKEHNRLVHLGVSFVESVSDNASDRIRQRPEIHLAQRYVDTGDYTTDGGTTLAAEFATVLGPVSVQSEWKNRWVNRTRGDSPTDSNNFQSQSAYVEASYFLTGESRNYLTAAGAFGRVTPIHSFDPASGGCGAWEIAGRFSWLDLQDGGLNGGQEKDVSAALNWYLFSNVKLQLNYVYANVDDTGDVLSNANGHIHTVASRAQIEF